MEKIDLESVVIYLGKIAVYALVIAAFLKLEASLPFKIILGVIVFCLIMIFFGQLSARVDLEITKKLLKGVLFSVDNLRLDPENEVSGWRYLKENAEREQFEDKFLSLAIGEELTTLINVLFGFVIPFGLVALATWLALKYWTDIEIFINSISK
jgi:hypothetical protein